MNTNLYLSPRWAKPLLAGAALLTLAAPLGARAQIIPIPDARRPSAHFGVTTGLGATWVVDHKLLNDPNYEYVQTYRRAPIGFTLGYHFNDRNGVQVEANRTMQGADFQITAQEDGNPRIGTKNIRLTYWSVPVLFKYTSGAARRTRFEFHVGPQINFLSEASDINRYTAAGTLIVTRNRTDLTVPTPGRTSALEVEANTQQSLATKADYRSTNLSAAFGFGIEIKIAGPVYFSALVRGTFGVNEIRSQAYADRSRAWGTYAGRNNGVVGAQVGLHWQFISPEEGHPKDRP